MLLSRFIVLTSLIWVLWISPAYAADQGFGRLSLLADEYHTDKGPNAHNFTVLYEHFFAPIREDVRRVLEIGVARGASMKMFSDYFPNAHIYGLDIDDTSQFDTDRVTTFIADQADRERLKTFVETHGGDFDLILDDGGHTMPQQQISFGFLFPHVKPGGYYIIEDVHTSLAPYRSAGVGFMRWNTTLNMLHEFMKTGQMKSHYMSDAEEAAINGSIEYVNLFRNDRRSMTCIIKKKK